MKLLVISIVFYLFTACSSTASSLTCCDVVNEYKKVSRIKSIPIDVAQDFKLMGVNLYIESANEKFSKLQDNYIELLYSSHSTTIKNQHIDDYCFSLNTIISDNNKSTIKKLTQFKAKWKEKYKNEIKLIVTPKKFTFNEISGCDNIASKMDELIIDKRGTKTSSNEHYLNIKNMYLNCLQQMKSQQNVKPKIDKDIHSDSLTKQKKPSIEEKNDSAIPKTQAEVKLPMAQTYPLEGEK